MESFEISEVFFVSPQELITAWLDSTTHGDMIGAEAEIQPQLGSTFSIWNGYITGKMVEIVPGKKIVQLWRTTEFPEGSPYSELELLFTPVNNGTMLTLKHSRIPEGQGKRYEEGWKEHYFEPMKAYFHDG